MKPGMGSPGKGKRWERPAVLSLPGTDIKIYKNCIWKIGFIYERVYVHTHTYTRSEICKSRWGRTHTGACILTCSWNIVTNKCQGIELYKYNYLFRLNALVIVAQKSIITEFFFKFKIAASPVVGQDTMRRPKSKRFFSISGLNI